ncbi:23094_t:CDS:2, partial [Entrophospora sp. SA101]
DSVKALALAGFDVIGHNEWVHTLLKKPDDHDRSEEFEYYPGDLE